MSLDFVTLDTLRKNHPGWKLLMADSAPLVVSFLHRAFIEPNIRVLSQADLVEALEDELYALRERLGADVFPRRAQEYLNDWASNDRGWLRKFYPQNSDEPHFDLTPTTEKTIAWLDSLTARPFVGTESRLLTIFELLRQMVQGSEMDPQIRVADLQKRRDELDTEIRDITNGDLSLLDDTGLKDRYQQFVSLARELLSDFREVEHNFRNLDRRVRERITLWEGAKGALLDEILGQRDIIADSDQGRSFRAFWDFLMSQSRQEELSTLLDQILRLPVIAETKPDKRLGRIHYDWLEAGEHTQRTVAQLSNLLTYLIPDFLDSRARSFEKRFGLLFDQPLIRFRVLDEALGRRLGLTFSDLAVPVNQFSHFGATEISVVITENKMNFLALPVLQNSIGIWGGGLAVSLLSECNWLESCRILYWGDIDVTGFDILSRLRGRFHQAEALLMDANTLDKFIHLAAPGKGTILPVPSNLTTDEEAALTRVTSENLMLEQEKLPQDVWSEALEASISKVPKNAAFIDIHRPHQRGED